MSAPTFLTFAMLDDGEPLVEARSRYVGLRRVRVLVKLHARKFGLPFSIGTIPLPHCTAANQPRFPDMGSRA